MMTEVFVVSDNIYSPIGANTAENFSNLKNNISGISLHTDGAISSQPFYASLFAKEEITYSEKHTKFEQLLLRSVGGAVDNAGIDPRNKNTVLIVSSTKGNISLLEEGQPSSVTGDRISLHHSARIVADQFGFAHTPIVISNACISGILALITGMRLIQSGQFETAVVTGADVITSFILSGFQSFQAISAEPCKPFDESRNGINLGEGAATIILSSNKKYASGIKMGGGATGNDANHISGPSRTGEELFQVIQKSLDQSGMSDKDIDFICAHGTATVYNDEMEAKAFTLAGMETIPVNSLKGFYGHTLGAAGLIETAISMESLKENILLPTRGFKRSGPATDINILDTLQAVPLKTCLKTASGFGGCNAAIIFSKQ